MSGRHSQPTPTSMGQGCMRVCHLHSWQNDRFFTCHCGSTGVKRTPIKSQHTKLTLEKKILPPLLLGFELATFRSRVRCSTNRLSRPINHTHTKRFQSKDHKLYSLSLSLYPSLAALIGIVTHKVHSVGHSVFSSDTILIILC